MRIRYPAVAIAAVVLLVSFSIFVIIGWPDERTVAFVDDFTFVLLSSTTAVFAGLAARTAEGRTRAAWIAMTVGLVCTSIGDMIWTGYEVMGHEIPVPSLADVGYLLFPVFACIALMLFWHGEGGRDSGLVIADGVIVAGSLFMMSWLLVLMPVESALESDGLERVVLLAYPVSALIVLTVAAVTLVRVGAGQRFTASLLALGMALTALSDNVFSFLMAHGRYMSGSVTDIGYMANLLLILFAAVEGFRPGPTRTSTLSLPGWASIWLPFSPMLVAVALAAFGPVESLRTGPILVAGLAIGIAILVRQYLVVRETRQLLAAAAERAMRDPLTGLANRILFHDRLEQALWRRHGDRAVAVLVIDLDDFKIVNDTLGHAVGDDVLTGVADRLGRCAFYPDAVGRIGGDEFGVLVQGPAQRADDVAEQVMRAFAEPFVVNGMDLMIRPSVGLAVTGADEVDMSSDELLERADRAMYTAKRSRAGGVYTFTGDEQPGAVGEHVLSRGTGSAPELAAVQAIELLGDLREAIERCELDLVYQPKVNLDTEDIVGVEALLRWRHPQRGMLSPQDFLPLVRRHDLLDEVNELVINRALDDMGRWRSAGIRLPVAVNFFAPSLTDPELPDHIERLVASRGLRPSDLTIEITEDLFPEQQSAMREVLHRLQDKGIRVGIDDFGTGYSALSLLCELPVDEVKLAGNLIAPVLTQPRTATMVRAVVELAREFGLCVVAEGIETAQAAVRLRELGCEIGQGYHFSQALTVDELIALMTISASGEPAPTGAKSN